MQPAHGLTVQRHNVVDFHAVGNFLIDAKHLTTIFGTEFDCRPPHTESVIFGRQLVFAGVALILAT